jgi:diguanylate cyclase (GGDEF)-like protein
MDRSPQSKILFVQHDLQYLASMREQLTGEFDFYSAATSEQALEMVRNNGPFEAVITDTGVRMMPSLELLEKLQQLAPATVRILITEETGLDHAKAAVEKGRAYRYVLKNSSGEELRSTIQSAVLESTRTIQRKQLEQVTAGLEHEDEGAPIPSVFDPELGIGSPEAMEVELQYAHSSATRYKRPYSIAIFDIDQFEEYSTHYGRRAAKLAHKLAAEHIRHSCRAADRIYRYSSGIPILLILPETPFEGAQILAKRIVQGFAARNIPNSKSHHGLLTLSGSITSYDPAQPDKNAKGMDMIDEAYLYLHVAQGQGGNVISAPLPDLDLDEA